MLRLVQQGKEVVMFPLPPLVQVERHNCRDCFPLILNDYRIPSHGNILKHALNLVANIIHFNEFFHRITLSQYHEAEGRLCNYRWIRLDRQRHHQRQTSKGHK